MIQKATGYVTGDDSIHIANTVMVDKFIKRLDYYLHHYPGEFLSDGHAIVTLTHLYGKSDLGS